MDHSLEDRRPTFDAQLYVEGHSVQRQGLYLPLVDAASFASMREKVLQFRLQGAQGLSKMRGYYESEVGASKDSASSQAKRTWTGGAPRAEEAVHNEGSLLVSIS